ncbi:MAG: HAD family phosphatase [Clostridia bacterium]|nr:HAD family phosphatase [Clostridia bacterium]
MIRNIVFDMGNVLVKFDPEMFMTREGILDPTDRQIVSRELFKSVEWVQMDMGVLTEDQLEPMVLARVPERLRSHVCHLLHHWSEPREMVPGMEDQVRRLKDAGYGIYLLSNASVSQPRYWDPMPISRYFDGTMISAFVRIVKPNPAIYRLFTEEFRLEEAECVFIDDFPLNVAGAVSCGWRGIVFHGDVAELEKKLKELGVRY